LNIIDKMKSKGMVPRAALYARFSSDNQREESIDAQLRAMHEFCKHYGMIIVHEYCDRAKSATSADRPEFLNMINDAKNGGFDFVIVHKLDRFSRDRYDSAVYRKELKKHDVSLVSVLENLDDSPESMILESVLEAMAEYYSRNLAREVMKGMRESALQCRSVGGRPPYGYKVNPETHKFEINEQESDAVKLIFERVANGIGYQEIISELNRLGYKTRLSNPFGKNSLTEILRNERYKGIYIFNRAASHNANHKRNNHSNKPEDEIIRIPGGMPQILDDEIFERVQVILKSRKQKEALKNAKEEYLLTGKVFCGICGCSYNGSSHHSGRNKILHVIYTCGKKHNNGDFHCKNKDINRNYLEDFILKRIGEIVFDEKNIPALIKTYYESLGELCGEGEKIIKKLNASLKSLNQKINNIVNIITETGSPALLENLQKLESEKQELAMQIEVEKSKMETNQLNEKEIIAAYRMAQELYQSGALPQRKQLVNLYLKRVLVYSEYIEVELNNVPSNLLKPTLNDDKLPTENGGQDAVHIYEIWLKIRKMPTSEMKRTLKKLVKARGVEPLSENSFT
jgi:site-specific DNA recombinase